MISKLSENILYFIESTSFYFVFFVTYTSIFGIAILPFFYFLNVMLEYIRGELLFIIVDIMFFAIYKVISFICLSCMGLWLIYYFFFCVNVIAKNISECVHLTIVKYIIRL